MPFLPEFPFTPRDKFFKLSNCEQTNLCCNGISARIVVFCHARVTATKPTAESRVERRVRRRYEFPSEEYCEILVAEDPEEPMMDCARCGGGMSGKTFCGMNEAGFFWSYRGSRCLHCGNVIDLTILENRTEARVLIHKPVMSSRRVPHQEQRS